jgi:hypothetical protein
MTVKHPALIAVALTLSISGCVPTAQLGPMSNPSMGYSGQEISAATGLPTALLRNEEQCKRSAAILANPGSTANERNGATTAARANACPGY